MVLDNFNNIAEDKQNERSTYLNVVSGNELESKTAREMPPVRLGFLNQSVWRIVK